MNCLSVPEEKLAWKRTVNKAVNEKWRNSIISQAELFSSLTRLSKYFTPGKCHPAIVPYESSSRDVNRLPVKVKILTGTYILQTNRVKFNQNEVDPVCLLCRESDEDLQHFLLDCKELSEIRNPIMMDIINTVNSLLRVYPSAEEYSLLQLVVDCNIIDVDQKDVHSYLELLQYNSRRLCYALHGLRYQKIGVIAKNEKCKSRAMQHT